MIDIEQYLLHSIRFVSTSKAKIKISLSKANKVACWKNTLTFRGFYDKPSYETVN